MKREICKKKSVRIFWRAAACKSSCADAANARPHNKRHAQLLAQVPGCTRPSPWGRSRAAQGWHSGACNGTITISRNFPCSALIRTAKIRGCTVQDPNSQVWEIPSWRVYTGRRRCLQRHPYLRQTKPSPSATTYDPCHALPPAGCHGNSRFYASTSRLHRHRNFFGTRLRDRNSVRAPPYTRGHGAPSAPT